MKRSCIWQSENRPDANMRDEISRIVTIFKGIFMLLMIMFANFVMENLKSGRGIRNICMISTYFLLYLIEIS